MTDTQNNSPTITPAQIAGGDPLLERLTGLALPSLLMGAVLSPIVLAVLADWASTLFGL